MMFLVYFQLALTVLVAATAAAVTSVDLGATLSATGGATVTLFNLWILVAAWPRILAKKQIAVGVAAIVFKFAILGLILYLVTNSKHVQLGWFAFGLGTVLPSVLVTAWRMPHLFPEKAEN